VLKTVTYLPFVSCNFIPCNFDGPSFSFPSFSAPPSRRSMSVGRLAYLMPDSNALGFTAGAGVQARRSAWTLTLTVVGCRMTHGNASAFRHSSSIRRTLPSPLLSRCETAFISYYGVYFCLNLCLVQFVLIGKLPLVQYVPDLVIVCLWLWRLTTSILRGLDVGTHVTVDYAARSISPILLQVFTGFVCQSVSNSNWWSLSTDYRALNGTAPRYLSEQLISVGDMPSRTRLRSSSFSQLAVRRRVA